MVMRCISDTEFRENLKKHLDSVCESRSPLVVTRQDGEPVVVISVAEYEALEETLHLLRDPANAERLLQSIREAEAGKLVEHDVGE
jgi:antitoxin YefM